MEQDANLVKKNYQIVLALNRPRSVGEDQGLGVGFPQRYQGTDVYVFGHHVGDPGDHQNTLMVAVSVMIDYLRSS